MTELPNFKIEASGEISNEFLKKEIPTFKDAILFVANLNYGRNANKDDLKSVFIDNCATCSTKHALLKKLADENGFSQVKLFLGIFKMNSVNTKGVSNTLKKYNLDYIPEAHNYLKLGNKIYDFTRANSSASDFENDLISEIEILPNQISDYKVSLHKSYLENWLDNNKQIRFTLAEIWAIREHCIQELTDTATKSDEQIR
jgi:hypothetical protein